MSSDLLLFETKDHVAVITLNRPAQRNAINQEMSRALMGFLQQVREDENIRAVILTGAGGTFSAGADLKERASGGGQRNRDNAPSAVIEANPAARWSTMTFEKPLIAAIDGYCLAGAMELALVCDIRICTPEAQFGLPEITRGFFPGGGGPQRLARSIPQSIAMELILTGDRIDAETALQAGIVSRMVHGRRSHADRHEDCDAHCRSRSARGSRRERSGVGGDGRIFGSVYATGRHVALDRRANGRCERGTPRLCRKTRCQL